MNVRSVFALALLASACSATSAVAQSNAQSNVYAVVGVGRSTIDVDPAAVNTFALGHGLAASTTAADSKSTGWKLQIGYQFGQMFAWEAGYMSLGTASFDNTNNLYTAKGDKKADLFNFDLVGKWPVSQQFSILGRLGGYRWETKTNLPTSAGMTRRTDDGFDFKFGAGVQYDFTKTFGLRGAFDRFNGIGSSDTGGDSKANLLSLDAVLKF